MGRPNNQHPQVSNHDLSQLRLLITERRNECGYIKLYKRMFKEGLIPKKSDGKWLEINGFKHHYQHIKRDYGLVGEGRHQISIQAIRFLYKAATGVALANRRRDGMIKEVSELTNLPIRVVKDVLAKAGDIG